ncbi:general secretion pathway protein GspB [Geobacter pelophilus]|uniref:General secretion pathway protein GspB n=1 Tax=Geoanaerobacter pelophilus TaxID=60036 RepID=A0AAW4L4L6_9BACT|nr:general secretion pathway protein GspB [Geoanaerobacter pelophilus]MBT0664475.1 general secretion pathway protein GspB [Geoanaerobacter pelophilus]
MSSILKALQKLEQDKETRKTKEPDISTAIKMSGRSRKEHANRWLVPALLAMVAAISILVTYSVMGGFSATRQTTGQPSRLQATQQEAQPAKSQTSPQTPATEVSPAVLAPRIGVTEPTAKVLENTSRPAKAPILPAPSVSTSQPAKPQESVTSQQPAPVAQTTEPPADKVAPKPRLRVSGIAWQQDSASRIAVINGAAVSEGGNVDGAKVEQIFPDKVRFSQGGKSFEISLDHEGR